MDNIRYNISPCSQSEVTAFIDKIDANIFVPNGAVKATERSHYDRYSYLAGESRVAIVYDTSANILSITGRQDLSKQLLDLFAPESKTVKRSTVPAQGSTPVKPVVKHQAAPTDIIKNTAVGIDAGKRAKLFVAPDRILRRNEYAPVATVLATSKGVLMTTDEIFPPQTAHKKAPMPPKPPVEDEYSGDVIYPPQRVQKHRLTSYGEGSMSPQQQFSQPRPMYSQYNTAPQQSNTQPSYRSIEQRYDANVNAAARPQTEHSADNGSKPVGIAISVGGRKAGDMPRRAVISFGSDDDGGSDNGAFRINTRQQNNFSQQSNFSQIGGNASVVSGGAEQPVKRKRGRPPKSDNTSKQADIAQIGHQANTNADAPTKRKRGRPPKIEKTYNDYVAPPVIEQTQDKAPPEYKNGYSVKNYPVEALNGAIKRLKEYGKKVTSDSTEFAGTPQEVKTYTVTDDAGQRVLLRYATKRMTLQLQGKRSDLFGEVMSQVSYDSDYSSALENYVENTDGNGGKRVSDVQNKLKKRLPTAYEFLSEQSRIDFSYGIHDFGQADLHLSDYSVLLVPAFRGLERFVFDLQRAEDIQVKMIGQAFDKDDSGRYVLKSGYCKRIGSVIYAEVLVALYTEYFSQRNFFAHSDNTDNNISRSIPERATALKIFDHLLDVVEYNAKKLKEIGFSTVHGK